MWLIYVTLEHKTSLKCQFLQIEMYTSSESWINHISIDVWFVMIGQYLKIWNLRKQQNLNIEKIIFKVVQIKFLAMHITNQKLSFDIFMVRNVQNIFMEHDLNIIMIFGIKEKLIILTHTVYCWLLLQIYPWMQCKSLWIKASAKCINIICLCRSGARCNPQIKRAQTRANEMWFRRLRANHCESVHAH